MVHRRSNSPFALLAPLCLVLATLAVGCADEKNPVLPPSTRGHGVSGTTSSSKADAGSEQGEAGQSNGDALTASDGSAIVPGPACNLLAQDCIDDRDGCYPLSGAGSCLRAGIRTALMTCLVDTDCDRGLVCIPISGLGSQGLCEPLCELTSGVARVCPSQVCAQRDGYPAGVGACASS